MGHGWRAVGEHDISEHLAPNELRFIGEELGIVEYNNLPEEEKARCRAFVGAWRNLVGGEAPRAEAARGLKPWRAEAMEGKAAGKKAV